MARTMNFEPEIELYSVGDQEIVYDTLVEKLGGDVLKLEKKLELYSHLNVSTLLASKTLDFINGSKNPRLYELKVKNLPTPVRFVASLEGRTLVLLDVIFTSGSNGAIEKRLPTASYRLEEWRERN